MGKSYKHIIIFALVLSFHSVAYSEDLTFRLVHPDHEKISNLPVGKVPIDQNIYEHFCVNGENYWIERTVQLDYTHIQKISVEMSIKNPNSPNWENVEISVNEIERSPSLMNPSMRGFTAVIQLNDKGQKALEDLTEKNTNRRLAAIFGRKILMAPLISEKISGNEVLIVGVSYDEIKGLIECANIKNSL